MEHERVGVLEESHVEQPLIGPLLREAVHVQEHVDVPVTVGFGLHQQGLLIHRDVSVVVRQRWNKLLLDQDNLPRSHPKLPVLRKQSLGPCVGVPARHYR